MAFANFLTNFTNGLFRHFVCFEKFHSPVSELIHLARCVKFNPYFIPGIVLIVFCGTQFNRRTNFIPRLAGFNPRLALIVFSGTGAWGILDLIIRKGNITEIFPSQHINYLSFNACTDKQDNYTSTLHFYQNFYDKHSRLLNCCSN